jgi:hypothetical protein
VAAVIVVIHLGHWVPVILTTLMIFMMLIMHLMLLMLMMLMMLMMHVHPGRLIRMLSTGIF